MAEARELSDEAGARWRAEVITGGRTSDYLNPRVHRPIIQFTCLTAARPKRYVSLPDPDPGFLARLTPVDLRALLARARAH